MTAPLPRSPLPRSLYADTAVSGPAAPPLEGDARADVVVVGGGFTGLSAALNLAEQGVDVRVLEANEIGWGASGRNGGQVNPGLKFDPDQIEADFGAEMGRRMVAFSGAAPQRVFDLIERHQIVCEARRDGTIRAAKSERHARTVRTSAAVWEAHGAPVRLLDHAAMASAMGTQIAARFLGAAPAELDMPITGVKEIPFHGLWRTALAGRMAYGRIRDSLGL